MARQQPDALQNLVNRLRSARKEAGDRLGEVLSDAAMRERAAAVADKIDDLRIELSRRLRGSEQAAPQGGRPAARPAASPAGTPAARVSGKPAARRGRKPAGAPAGKRPGKPLNDMTVRELQDLASKRKIAGRSSMRKAELVDALRRG